MTGADDAEQAAAVGLAVGVGHAPLQLPADGRVFEPILQIAELVGGVEDVGKAKVGDDDVAISVQQQVLELQVPVHDTLLVQVADAGHQLGEQTTGGRILEVAVSEDVVKELTARSVFEDDADVPVGLDHLVEPYDVGMGQCSEDGDLAIDLGEPIRVWRY